MWCILFLPPPVEFFFLCGAFVLLISEAVVYLDGSWHCHHLLKNLHIMLAKYFRVVRGSRRRREPLLGHPQVEQGRYVVCDPQGPLLWHYLFLEGLPG